MADVKDEFSPALVAALAAELAHAWPAFPAGRFSADAATGLAPLALMQRVRHIAAALAAALPSRFIAAAAAAVPDRAVDSPSFTGWMTLPCGAYVADHGLEQPCVALPVLARLSPGGPARARSGPSSNTTPNSPSPTCKRGPETPTNTCAGWCPRAPGHGYPGPASYAGSSPIPPRPSRCWARSRSP